MTKEIPATLTMRTYAICSQHKVILLGVGCIGFTTVVLYGVSPPARYQTSIEIGQIKIPIDVCTDSLSQTVEQ
jgi:hypothetical protein